MAHAVNLLVDGGVLCNIGVGHRKIGFGLIVIIVADEIFHGIVREQLLELAVQLGGKGFVGRQHQRRLLRALYDMRHGKSLARARDAKQHLMCRAAENAPGELLYGLRLVALRLVIGYKLKVHRMYVVL